MKLSAIAMALLLSAPAAGAAPQQKPEAPGGELVLSGCVTPGAEKDAYILTNVTEVAPAGRSAMPPTAHGRRVIFWLDDEKPLVPHAGKMVEVRGTVGDIEESEIELKAGKHKDGGLVVEFEGPGKDVTAANSAVGGAVGTSGRTTPEKDDVKTFLIKVDVKDVKATDGSCQ